MDQGLQERTHLLLQPKCSIWPRAQTSCFFKICHCCQWVEQLWLHLVYMLMLQLKLLLLRNWCTTRSSSAWVLRESWTAVQTLVTSCSGRGIGVHELEMQIGAASQAIEKAEVRALSLYLQLDGRNHCWVFFSYVKSSSMQRVWTVENKKYSQA